MTDLRKAAEMALVALEWYVNEDDVIESMAGNEPWVEGKRNAEKSIQALRQALAQPEQEPVVGMFEEKLPDQNPPPWSRSYRLKRDWVGLTDDDFNVKQVCEFDVVRFAKYIEAKLKEKNSGSAD